MIRIFKSGPSLSLLGATIIVVPITVAALTPTLLKSPGNLDWVSGQWTVAYEKEFDAQLAIRDFALSTWGAMEYVLFKGGRTGVLVGSEDWLFTSEEFQYFSDSDGRMRKTEDVVFSVADLLNKRGIKLVVAVIPDKSRVYPEQLGRYERPDYVTDRLENFRTALLDHGIIVPDLLRPLLEAKQSGAVFLHTDTHWTPAGASVAAASIAQAAAGIVPEEDQKAFVTTPAGEVEHKGDLLNFIPMGFLASLGPAPDFIETQKTVAADTDTASSLGLFDTAAVPVALVGTSYSANALWNFAGSLSEHLRADVANAAQEGKGPLVPMLEYLKSPTFTESPPLLVVWDIPERFITVDYSVSPIAEE